MSTAWATPPKNEKAKSGQISAGLTRITKPKMTLIVKSQVLVITIKRRRGKRSMPTPAMGASPNVASERTRLSVPNMAPEPVSS